MNISTSFNVSLRSQHGLLPVTATKPASATTDTVVVNSNVGDKVTLSSEGVNASRATVDAELAKLALPSWFAEFKPEWTILNGDMVGEGEKFVRMSEQLATDGELSAADQRAIQSYLDNNMPATSRWKQNEIEYKQNQALYEEYGAIYRKHSDAAMAEQGIFTDEDWIEKVRNAPDDNQALRFSIMDKMFNDPRAMELMDTLRIIRPKV